MVKAEGWLDKSGSKWKTMPDQMFQYRSASFFGRIYAPDVLNGMHSVEEIKDSVVVQDQDFIFEELKALYMEKEHLLSEDDKIHFDRIIKNKETASYGKCTRTLEKLKDESDNS